MFSGSCSDVSSLLNHLPGKQKTIEQKAVPHQRQWSDNEVGPSIWENYIILVPLTEGNNPWSSIKGINLTIHLPTGGGEGRVWVGGEVGGRAVKGWSLQAACQTCGVIFFTFTGTGCSLPVHWLAGRRHPLPLMTRHTGVGGHCNIRLVILCRDGYAWEERTQDSKKMKIKLTSTWDFFSCFFTDTG